MQLLLFWYGAIYLFIFIFLAFGVKFIKSFLYLKFISLVLICCAMQFIVSDLIFRCLIHFALALAYGDGGLVLLFFTWLCSSPSTKASYWRVFPFSIVVFLAPLMKIIFPYIWGFISGPSILLYLSVSLLFFVIVFYLYCQYHVVFIIEAFVVQFQVRQSDTSNHILFSQKCLAIQGLLCFHTILMTLCSISLRNAFEIMIENASYNSLDNKVILTTLILSIYEYKICFSYFVSSSISPNNVLQFSVHRAVTCFVRFILTCYFFRFILQLQKKFFFISWKSIVRV